MNCKIGITAICLFLFPNFIFSQLSLLKDKNAAVEIAILDESINFPTFRSFNYSYNPAFYIAYENILKEKKQHDWHLHTSLGFYYHRDWQFAPNLNIALGYRKHINRFNGFARLGVGYSHVFAAKASYNRDGSEWKQVKDFGSPRFQPSLTLGLGYQLKDAPYSPQIALVWSQSVDIPLNIFSGVHHFMGLSYKFYPFN